MTKPKKRLCRDWGMRLTSGLMAAAMSFSLATPSLSFALEDWGQEPTVLVETLGEIETTETEIDDGSVEFNVGGTVDVADTTTYTHWSDPYTEKMVEYGYMRSQDATEPDAEMSRAEFAAVINRAYNYTETSGNMNFEDVSVHDWFYDDIDIATSAGFITGTSPTTVEPNELLTRETTAFILGKNLMLPTEFGEDLNFTDTRDISSWSRSLVKATSEYGLMAGYTDGTFRPLNYITRGEISALVMKAIGTPILQGGETSLNEVYGNVTITEAGTILRNTVIAGDLHISNGIGLGSVTLENVTVLGRIVISGGESQAGEESILLRNVVAEELVIDNLADEKVSVRVDGSSYIENTYVLTNAYVEDTTTTTNGLINIIMDADPGISLDLAGRIKNVTNTSSGTVIRVVDGTVDVMNIDETATEVVTEVLRGAEILQLNIDVATNVTGDGDVKNVVVNADDVVIEMLPDNIEIRPGVDANINGVDMDNLTAEEYSQDPKILSGYPLASDIAPTSLDAIFATNKTGTVYWAISNITQGSVSEADLVSPPTYGNIALQYGSIDITEAEEEFIALIADLPIGGNYYLSAVLVDTRGDHSPVKVIAFSTPDDSVPAFAEGYPYMSSVDNTSAQVTVMATKDCKLYYAVLPKGAVAPTATDFLAGSVSGNFGFGTQTLTKNKSESYTVSDLLNELTEYDLYLWLTDADGMNYSEVQVLSFMTTDGTPPVFNQDVQTTTIGTTDVSFAFNLNEKGTVYWAVVPTGTYYPSVKPGDTTGNLSEPLTSEYAAYSVMWGIGASFSGSVAASANTTMDFKLTGLDLETSYDMYYVARDEAGNFSSPVQMLTFNTIDNTPPTFVEQQFSHVASEDTAYPQPYATTSISLVFSEGIQATNSGQSFMQLYTNVLTSSGDDLTAAKNTFASTLEYCFPFYTWNGANDTAVQVRDADNELTVGDDWVIDYRNVTVTMLDGLMYINFPTDTDNSATSALNLSAGVTYGFKIQNIRDSSSDANIMVPASQTLDTFTTVYAEVSLWPANLSVSNYPYSRDENGDPTNNKATVDQDLLVKANDMGNVDQTVTFEMRMEADDFVSFDVYMRVVDSKSTYSTDMLQYYPSMPSMEHFTETGVDLIARQEKISNNWTPDENGWIYLSMDDMAATLSNDRLQLNTGGGVGLIYEYWGYKNNTEFPFLYSLSDEYQYQFVFEVTQYDSTTERASWNGVLNVEVNIWAGNFNNVTSIGVLNSPMTDSHKSSMSLVSTPENYPLEFWFSDSKAPEFSVGSPQVIASDTSGVVELTLNRAGELTYVVVESSYPANLSPLDSTGSLILGDLIPNINDYNFVLSGLTNWPDPPWPDDVQSPTASTLLSTQSQDTTSGKVIAGTLEAGTSVVTIPLEDLSPLTEYYIYFVTKSSTGGSYSQVYLAKFITLETEKPKYNDLKAESSTGNVTWQTHVDTSLQYLMLTTSDTAQSEFTKWVYEPFYDWLLKTPDELSQVPVNVADSSSGYYTFIELYQMSTRWLTNDMYFYSSASGSALTTQAYTVLDFLTSQYQTTDSYNHPDYSSGYSMFDVFASDSMKTKLYDSISSQSNNIVSQGSATVDALELNTAVRDTATGYDPDFQYVFFVMGYNTNVSNPDNVANTYTFRSLANFSVTDLSGPTIEGLYASVKISDWENTANASIPTNFTGSLSVSFDKYLYANTGASTYFLKMNPSQNDPSTSFWDGQITSLTTQWRTSDSTLFTVDNNTEPDLPSKAIHINFEDIESGDYVQIFGGTYFLSNKNGTQYNSGTATTSKTLTLTFKTKTVSDSSSVTTESSTTANGITTTTTTVTTTTEYTTYYWWESNWDVDWASGSDINHATASSTSYKEVNSTSSSVDTPTTNSLSVDISSNMGTESATLMVGETLSLDATIEGTNVEGKTVTWSGSTTSSTGGLKTKSTNGNNRVVEANVPGTYTMTAKVDGITSTYSVTVIMPTVELVNNDSSGILAGSGIGTMTATIKNCVDPTALTGTWSVKSNNSTSTAYISLSNATQGFKTSNITHSNYTKVDDTTWTATIYYKATTETTGTVNFAFGTNNSQTFTVSTSGSAGTGAG